jgi:hypothetical protein
MTYPNDPNPNRLSADRREGMSVGTMAALALAVMLVLGAIAFTISGGDRTASTPTASTTTGQSDKAPSTSPPQTR